MTRDTVEVVRRKVAEEEEGSKCIDKRGDLGDRGSITVNNNKR